MLVQVDGDGTVAVLAGAAVQNPEGRGLLVAEGLIALLCAQACALSGTPLDEGGYGEPVDVALHVDGLRSSVSYQHYGPHEALPPTDRRPYGEDRYREGRRSDIAESSGDPVSAARALVWPLTRVTAGEGWDPVGTVRP